MNTHTVDVLKEFYPITLKEMDKVKLMDRHDTKFIFKPELLPNILYDIKNYYNVLEVENKRIQNYSSLYFDTDNFKFYLDHHNGKMNRHKIRFREYSDTDLHFLEVKFKNNKGDTRKKRIKIPKEIFQLGSLSENEMHFIRERLTYEPASLFPKLSVKNSRIALVHHDFKERATVDMNLSYTDTDTDTDNVLKKEFFGMIILEVKQDKFSLSSELIKIMHKYRVSNVRISKYCLGVNSLYPLIKYNRFKPRITAIKKLCL